MTVQAGLVVAFNALRACFELLFWSSCFYRITAHGVNTAFDLLQKYYHCSLRLFHVKYERHCGLAGAVRLPDVFHVTVPPEVVVRYCIVVLISLMFVTPINIYFYFIFCKCSNSKCNVRAVRRCLVKGLL